MHIPGYTIIRELGRGGMATVYLAKQDRLGRQVALKVMQPQATLDQDFASRFIKEGRIIAQLQHPQIVTIYDFDIVDGIHYFSMEHLPNGTLSDLIERGLPTERAIRITRSIAQALSVAHDHGVIHRDIKPQNILFRTDGTPVLTDFGIARAVGGGEVTQLTGVGMIIGSPRYMSPEQSTGKPIDARSDLYSLGVVFYEMLMQELPYQAEDVISLAMKHCTAPIPVLPEALSRFQPILEKLLAKKPEDRFRNTQELIRALDAVEKGTKIAPLPDDEATRIVSHEERESYATAPYPQAAPRRSKIGLFIIAFSLTAAVAGSVYYFVVSPPSEQPDELVVDSPPPDPDRLPLSERYEALALEHLRDGELPQSLEIVELALDNNPNDNRLNALKAEVVDRIAADKLQDEAQGKLDEGAFDESLTLIQQGLEHIPDHVGLTALRDNVEQAREQHKAAQATKLLEQAQAALDKNALAESMRLIREGLALAPGNARFKALETKVAHQLDQQQAVREILAQASSLIDEGLLSESLAMIEKGLESAPGNAELNVLKQKVTAEMAREAARKAAELSEQAQRLAQQGAFDDAIKAVDQALSQQPKDSDLNDLRNEMIARQRQARADASLRQARAAFVDERLAEALRLAEEGLEIQPGHDELSALKSELLTRIAKTKAVDDAIDQARALLREQRFDESLNIVDEALKDAADHSGLRNLRNEILDSQRQHEEDRARALAQRAQGLFQQASQLFESGDLDGSLELVNEGLQLTPDQSNLKDLKQRILERQTLATKIEQQFEACTSRIKADKALPAAEAIEGLKSAAHCFRDILALEKDNKPVFAKLTDIKQQLTDAFSKALSNAETSTANQLFSALENAYPDDPQLEEMRTRLDHAERLLPEMVAIKGGCFQMGSPKTAPNHEPDEQVHRVCVDDFKLAKYETRIEDFQRFIEAEGYETDAEYGTGGVSGCWAFDLEKGDDAWNYQAWANWRKPNKYRENNPKDPVTCVSKNDAVAYIDWLNKATGQRFRLPTEAEWEYAARASTATTRYWGNRADAKACEHGNTADAGHDWGDGFPCDDGYEWVAPTGQFIPNAFGAYDMLGNVLEWTCSEYDPSYGGAETKCATKDSSAPIALRGGAWNSGPAAVRSAYRNRNYPESRYNFVGFRLAQDAEKQ